MMIKDRRFPLRFTTEPSMAERIGTFLTPYDCRIYSNNGNYIDIGSGSLGVIERLSVLASPAGANACMASVGRWCEIAASAEVLGHAEHDNDQPVNVGLSGLRPFAPELFGLGLKPPRPIQIGNGVVISAGARILSGASIGDGSVVGANAVVTRDVAPGSIVAGVPARLLRRRPVFQPWWNFSVSYLLANLANIQTVAKREAGHEWREDRPRFVLRDDGNGYSVLGFTDGENIVPLSAAPDQVRAYIDQAFAPGMRQAYWVPDCWA